MSDMEQTDVVAPTNDAPAEPVAPAAPPVEPTAEELQAEIDALQKEIDAQDEAAKNDAALAAAPEPTPVLARTPSSDSETQQPEAAPEPEAEPLSLEDATRVLVILVKAHRTAGDADVESALADVEAALPAL